MYSWFVYSIVALVGYGVLNLIFKTAGVRGFRSVDLIFYIHVSAAVVSAFFTIFGRDVFRNFGTLIFLSLLGSITYFINIFCRTEALRYVDTTISMPLVRMDIIIIVSFSLLFLHEQISSLQSIALCLGVLIVFLAGFEKSSGQSRKVNNRRGIYLSLGSAIFSAANIITCRYAAKLVDFPLYLTLLFLIGIPISLILKGGERSSSPRAVIGYGLVGGVINAVAAISLLTAFMLGPLSIISVINGLSFVVTIVCAIIFFKEIVTARKLCIIIGAIAAVLLLNAS